MPSLKEIEAVSRLPAKDRYPYLVKRVADGGELVVLRDKNGSFSLLGDNNGRQFLPVWSHADYARLYAKDGWPDHQPDPIDVHHFIDELSGNLRDSGILIAPFPVIGSRDVVVSLDDFIANLRHELDQIE